MTQPTADLPEKDGMPTTQAPFAEVGRHCAKGACVCVVGGMGAAEIVCLGGRNGRAKHERWHGAWSYPSAMD